MLIVGILVLTLLPIQHAYRVMNRTCASHVQAETDDFCDNLRHKGYFDERMLDDFIRSLARTGKIYDIRIIHSRQVIWPMQPGEPGYDPEHPYVIFDEKTALPEILESMHAAGMNGRYRMDRGDSISVEVVERSASSAGAFWSMLGSGGDALMCIRAAGGVTNADE